jgi:uncharacterized protein YxjI
MHPVLNRNTFVIKEHVGMFKAANNYDMLDPETGEILVACREPNLGMFTKLLRFTDYKRMTPFDLHLATPDGQQVLNVTRGVSVFLSKVNVLDCDGDRVGGFKQKFFTIGGKFDVLDDDDQVLCKLQGKWTSWEFKFLSGDEIEFATVTKQWAGLGKELFTTADTYVLEISEHVPEDHPLRVLIVAAVMCIDMVLKE